MLNIIWSWKVLSQSSYRDSWRPVLTQLSTRVGRGAEVVVGGVSLVTTVWFLVAFFFFAPRPDIVRLFSASVSRFFKSRTFRVCSRPSEHQPSWEVTPLRSGRHTAAVRFSEHRETKHPTRPRSPAVLTVSVRLYLYGSEESTLLASTLLVCFFFLLWKWQQ